MVTFNKTYAQIVNDIVNNILSRTTDVTDFNLHSIIRNLIESFAIELESPLGTGLYNKIEEVYKSTKVASAEGDDLTDLGELVGVNRKQGSKALVMETFELLSPPEDSTTVPTGTKVYSGNLSFTKTSTNDDILPMTYEVTIPIVDGLNLYILPHRSLNPDFNIVGYQNLQFAPANNPDNFSPILDTDLGEFTIMPKTKRSFATSSDMTTIEDCEDYNDWNEITGASYGSIDLDSSNIRLEGTNSITFETQGSNRLYGFDNQIFNNMNEGFDISSKKIGFSMRMNSNALNVVKRIRFRYGIDENNYSFRDYLGNSLVEGWNDLVNDLDTDFVVGNIDYYDMRYIGIEIELYGTGVNLSKGDIQLDYFFLSEIHEKTTQYLNIGGNTARPANFENGFLKFTYQPMSVDVEMECDVPGTVGNIIPNRLTSSNLMSFPICNNYESGFEGTDTENDISLRRRILSNRASARATKNSIISALSNLPFVTSTSLENAPGGYVDIKADNIPGERHTGTDISFELNNKTAFQDNNLVVYDWNNPTTRYVHGEDYLLDYSSTITLTSQTTIPNPYDIGVSYRWGIPGTFRVFVSGQSNIVVGSTRWQQIMDVINEYKASGTLFTVDQVILEPIPITIEIAVSEGYSLTDAAFKERITNAIIERGNHYDISEDLINSQLESAAMSIPGVKFARVVLPNEDVDVSVYEFNPLSGQYEWTTKQIKGKNIPEGSKLVRITTVTINEAKELTE